ncbi:MAG: serine hydrolase [Rhodobacteraceae bacterium]|nr:serine hydrolase [Paracoccaceae bacterium]
MTNRVPNPELQVGPDNKQWWNRAENRRFGFHNAHILFRRAHMVRARHVLPLSPAPDATLAALPAVADLTGHPAFSALVCARGTDILYERTAPDFGPDRVHSIQSISKMHLHLIVGRLLQRGLIDLSRPVGSYLPEIGPGYAAAPVQALLDMNVTNAFCEDYSDPLSDCYTEEIALGWRLPDGDAPEPTMRDFARGIAATGPGGLSSENVYKTDKPGVPVQYKSANSDVLTLICARLCPTDLRAEIEAIADAAGYSGAFHISLDAEGLPAFSGGGCLSPRDLARFGLLFHRISGGDTFGNPEFLARAPLRDAPRFDPPREFMYYSNHLMTDGRFVGHGGYGGQFLMVDLATGLVCAFLSVLDNDAGYDTGYMTRVILALKSICHAAPSHPA